MKVADYVIQFLADKGIDHIFVVYGGANGDLIDAFTRTPGTEYVCTMHEQAAGFAAEGYAKISGKPGVAIATSGPGGQNLLTPIANCYYDSTPAIFITGQVNRRFLRPHDRIRQTGFQECPIVDIARPVVKYAKMVEEPQDLLWVMERVWWEATTGRPGPVLVDLPVDVQKSEINVKFSSGIAFGIKYEEGKARIQASAFIADYFKASRPAILVGAGVRYAGAIENFNLLASELGIPCFPTWNALDILSSSHPYYGGRVGTFGGAGRNLAIQQCDLLLVLGSRLSGRITGGNPASFAPNAKKYVVDIDRAMLVPEWQQVRFDVNIYADAGDFIKQCLEAIPIDESVFKRGALSSWLSQVHAWRDQYDPVAIHPQDPDVINPYHFIRELSRQMGPEDILVTDTGGTLVVCSQAFETKTGQRFLTSNGNSPMGFAMCGAIGAALANRGNGQVVCVIGDGGFNMNIQELQTIKNYGLKIKVFILNNHCYGITRQFQETNFEGRCEACGPKGYVPPCFPFIVRAYGLQTIHLVDPRRSSVIIEKVLSEQKAVICDVDIGDWHRYEPRVVGWDTPIDKMSPEIEEA